MGLHWLIACNATNWPTAVVVLLLVYGIAVPNFCFIWCSSLACGNSYCCHKVALHLPVRVYSKFRVHREQGAPLIPPTTQASSQERHAEVRVSQPMVPIHGIPSPSAPPAAPPSPDFIDQATALGQSIIAQAPEAGVAAVQGAQDWITQGFNFARGLVAGSEESEAQQRVSEALYDKYQCDNE